MFARFAYEARSTRPDARPGLTEWLEFIHEVNAVAPDLFGRPEMRADFPRAGYDSEVYPDAWVVHARNRDEGVRIVAQTDRARDAFTVAARRLGLTLAGDGSDATAEPAP